jgi:hypothetical protein
LLIESMKKQPSVGGRGRAERNLLTGELKVRRAGDVLVVERVVGLKQIVGGCVSPVHTEIAVRAIPLPRPAEGGDIAGGEVGDHDAGRRHGGAQSEAEGEQKRLHGSFFRV